MSSTQSTVLPVLPAPAPAPEPESRPKKIAIKSGMIVF